MGNKLELTWYGKKEQIKVEPRLLIHDPTKDYGEKETENMLIHGDNLLALKALEKDYAGKISLFLCLIRVITTLQAKAPCRNNQMYM